MTAECPSCSNPVRAEDRFCSICGAKLLNPGRARPRYLTVLFIDLSESTSLTAALGNEAMFDMVSHYQQLCQEVITSAGGYVARFMGDGVLAYFGYPEAVKNSAELAIQAADRVIRAVQAMDVPDGHALNASAGIAAGWTMVGEMHEGKPAQEALAIGDTVNTAARLQALAGAGRVAVAEDIVRKVDPARVTLDAGGTREVKGLSEPLQVWFAHPVERPVDMQDLIGRRGDLARLNAAWDRAAGGAPVLLDVVARGGFGKTTLVREFLRQTVPDGLILELRGLQHRRFQSFAPFRRMIRERLGLHPGDAPTDLAERLAAWAPPAVVPGLSLLLGLDPTPLAPLVRAQRITEALRLLMLELVPDTPSVLFIEDGHWIDQASFDLMRDLVEGLASKPVLILNARRPELMEGFGGDAAETLDLAELDAKDAATMVAHIDADNRLPAEVRDRIVTQARGVPLYLRHITQAVLERPEGGVAQGIPPSLIEALLERFDRVEDAQPLVEAAAVLGGELRSALLAEMIGQPEEVVQGQIAELVRRRLFASGPKGTVTFDHALIQEAVLETLHSRDRRALHGKALAAYHSIDPEGLAAAPGIAAHHLLGAEDFAAAIPALNGASQLSLMSGDLAAAGRLLEQAEGALERLEQGQAREQLEITTRVSQGNLLVQSRGFNDDSVGAAFDRALQLSLKHEAGGLAEFQTAWGIWAHKLVRGDQRDAEVLVERMQAIAEDNPELEVLACSAASVTAFTAGDFALQEKMLARTAALYDLDAHRMQALVYQMDSLQLAQLFGAHGRWITGNYTGFLSLSEKIDRHMAALDLKPLEPYTRIFSKAPHAYGTPPPAALSDILDAMGLAETLGQPFWLLAGSAWASLSRRQLEGGAAALPDQMQAVAMLGGAGLRLTAPIHEAGLALSFIEAGELEDAEAALAPALADCRADQQLCYGPEVLRVAARLCAARGHDAGAKARLDEAAAMAEAQGARAWLARIYADRAALDDRGEADLPDLIGGLHSADMADHPALAALSQG
ncbi:ATP-binding protein [Oceanomicrobium pacificus]|uniref:AAA family ATPase n=1 Tax=Oceanomicrobium pacificus TaxID=2692916 RepID=A0A6B0THQ0_9RHOB|nr:AAA family ATPase [Oceanomicrobium pacificus]MXU63910.1 AAA family ATPase [Oceanomicrobium pacificus]